MRNRWLKAGGSPNRSSEPAVGQLLYALAVARRPRVIVETGLLNAAGSTPWLAWAAQEIGATHYAIDVDKQMCELAAQFIERRNWSLANKNVGTIIVHADVLKTVDAFNPQFIDFLFIDDDHTTAHVEAEIKAFLPKMAPGSAMFFHDVIGTGEDFHIWDVIQRYGGIRLANRTFNYPENAPFGGLGMISVDDSDRNGLYNLPTKPPALPGDA